MTSDRSRAYGRVMKTLDDLGPTKLHPAEQEQIREAADALFFCEDIATDPHALDALDGVVDLAEQLIDADRWLPETATRVIRDLESCGPVAAVG